MLCECISHNGYVHTRYIDTFPKFTRAVLEVFARTLENVVWIKGDTSTYGELPVGGYIFSIAPLNLFRPFFRRPPIFIFSHFSKKTTEVGDQTPSFYCRCHLRDREIDCEYHQRRKVCLCCEKSKDGKEIIK